jgi:uncharacterized repeat protein (TIGR03803 family)
MLPLPSGPGSELQIFCGYEVILMRPSILRGARFIFLALACAQLARQESAAASGGKIIYTFSGDSDGANPQSDLIVDAAGNLYGTTYAGGKTGCGTVYELVRSGASWTHRVLYGFGSVTNDGCEPQAGLVFDHAGNLYGTTTSGGRSQCGSQYGGCGTVFRLAPSSQGSWSEEILYSFGGYAGDGQYPNTDLVFDSQGNLYGATSYGGTTSRAAEATGPCSYDGCGTVFRLSPNSDGTWTESTIHAFAGPPNDGAYPIGAVALDAAGNLYGTTLHGGSAICIEDGNVGCGSAYELTPNSSGGWAAAQLYSFHRFQGTAVYPSGGFVFAHDGGILGTSSVGGNGDGTFFQLQNNGKVWEQKVLYRFYGDPDGVTPVGRLVEGPDGNLYGATAYGGKGFIYGGTVFELDRVNGGWKERVLFHGDSMNNTPQAGPVVDSQGNIYGTFIYGSSKYGAVYEVTP